MPDINEPVPIIEGLNGKIGVLERRLAHLERRLGDALGRSSGSAKDFDRAEAAALRAALKALRYVGQVRR